MKSIAHLIILWSFISCQNHSSKLAIVKIETEYVGSCAGVDSCIKTVNTLFSDSSVENTFYVQYPSVKIVTLRDGSGKFISETKSINGKTVRYTMQYDELGNEKNYVKESLSKPMPKLIETFENTYNQENRIIAQTHYDHHGNLKTSKTFQYDTLGYSKVTLEKDQNGDSVSMCHFDGKKLVLEKKVNRSRTLKFKYNEKGQLLFEDKKHRPEVRRFYYYSDDLLVKTTENYRQLKGKTVTFRDVRPDDRISKITKFKYSLDGKGRPVKTRKLTLRKEKIVSETVVITKYY